MSDEILKLYHDYFQKMIDDIKQSFKWQNNDDLSMASHLLDFIKLKSVLKQFFEEMLHHSQIADFPNDQAHTNLRWFYENKN